MANNTPWEDCLLERKTENDLKDLLKTIVAFANSVKPNHVATILIGERDDGTAQGVKSPERIQKTVRETAGKIYPAVIWRSEVYEKDGEHCVRVEIEFSGETPHFGGPAWVRQGSSSVPASEEVFQRLIDYRTSKVRELAKWIDREVMFSAWGVITGGRVTGLNQKGAVLREVNSFYATFEFDNQSRQSESLETLSISWDHEHDCLKVEHKPLVL